MNSPIMRLIMINWGDYFVNCNFTKVHTDNWFALSVNHYFGKMFKTVNTLLNTLHLMTKFYPLDCGSS
jgi:hypothetical protein